MGPNKKNDGNFGEGSLPEGKKRPQVMWVGKGAARATGGELTTTYAGLKAQESFVLVIEKQLLDHYAYLVERSYDAGRMGEAVTLLEDAITRFRESRTLTASHACGFLLRFDLETLGNPIFKVAERVADWAFDELDQTSLELLSILVLFHAGIDESQDAIFAYEKILEYQDRVVAELAGFDQEHQP
ncbi:MAG TPA: hypothetical protein PLC15_17620 [Candidatus Obscuribacter sp.]|nr:hypothetical protein [Candidatus Obscuribacter sp.]MBK9281454.1 hypothetical protein [Candidatus Obscuribacter sp.]MBL8085026.1 hypothetical protein [Candidatus Obscuribacter sp.]HNB17206.1 hypothetical protein [Candidatus Obscuribacter sp.]